MIFPLSGVMIPAIAFKVKDLPEPDSPSKEETFSFVSNLIKSLNLCFVSSINFLIHKAFNLLLKSYLIVFNFVNQVKLYFILFYQYYYYFF